VKQVPAPPQLNFDFDQHRKSDSHSDGISLGTCGAAASIKSYGVIDLAAALSKKQEAHTRLLYRQILDSVKHLER
jgi:hypothetical protein